MTGLAAPATVGTYAPPNDVRPVGEGSRIAPIDVLRGVALLGIFTMNVQSFAMLFGASASFEHEMWRRSGSAASASARSSGSDARSRTGSDNPC